MNPYLPYRRAGLSLTYHLGKIAANMGLPLASDELIDGLAEKLGEKLGVRGARE